MNEKPKRGRKAKVVKPIVNNGPSKNEFGRKARPTSRRSFGGKLVDFTSRAEQNFEKKHLDAYLKGKKYFRYGFKTVESLGKQFRIPAMFEVKESWS